MNYCSSSSSDIHTDCLLVPQPIPPNLYHGETEAISAGKCIINVKMIKWWASCKGFYRLNPNKAITISFFAVDDKGKDLKNIETINYFCSCIWNEIEKLLCFYEIRTPYHILDIYLFCINGLVQGLSLFVRLFAI